MRIKWRGLELPSRVVLDEDVSTSTYGRFIIEPFERGFGTTIGNSLRRVLLSSLEGAAVSSVRILNAPHEFTSIPGVTEDVTDIILNVKQLVVRLEGSESRVMRVSRKTPGPVTAGDIQVDANIEVINPELVLATLTENVNFEMELKVTSGRGYQPAAESRGAEQEIGVIAVDAIYSPVLRVRYSTEDTRVGQRTNYDRLILEVWTRGTITPEEALVEAARILRKHLNPFLEYDDLGDDLVQEAIPLQTVINTSDVEVQAKLEQPITSLDLSARAMNCLETSHVRTIGELVRMTEADLLRIRAFGRTSLREVRRKLAQHGLTLGTTFTYDPMSTGGGLNTASMLAT